MKFKLGLDRRDRPAGEQWRYRAGSQYDTESCHPRHGLPSNDEARLGALRGLLILDTPPEQRFDGIVAFAAQEFDMPMLLLTLVDSERQ